MDNSVSNPSIEDVFPSTGLPPDMLPIIKKIASRESTGFNIRYGGANGPQTFSDYSEHPNVAEPIPGQSNLHSTAAGISQMLASTWKQQADKLGFQPGSDYMGPKNQLLATADLAATTYKSNTNRDLLADYSAGKVDWGALAGQWPSLAVKASGGKAAPSSSQGSPGQTPNVNSLVASGLMPGDNQLAPSNKQPNQTNLPMLAMIQLLAPNHRVSQVDYDPWKVAPKLNGGAGG